jgi:hypothetical protein
MKSSKLVAWVVAALLMLAVAPAALAQGGIDPCGNGDPCDQNGQFAGTNNGDPCGNGDPCDQNGQLSPFNNGLCGTNNGPFNTSNGPFNTSNGPCGVNNGSCGNGFLSGLFLDLFGNCGLFG